MAKRVTIVGTGTWGTTLAVLLARKKLAVSLLARSAEEQERLSIARENQAFLPGVLFPDKLVVTHSAGEALNECDVVLMVVPSQTMRANLVAIKDHLAPKTIIVSAAKGLETGSCKRMTEIIAEESPGGREARICALSGPNLAREIAAGRPATTVIASTSSEVATAVQDILMTPSFRVYTNSDVAGVELGGALKNVIALGAGIGDGLGVGDNAKAAFLTRGLAEIARLGVAAGANPMTFAGLAGLGDLVATCASRFSRNRFVGEQLAQGKSLREIQASMANVAEGVPTTKAAKELASRYRVEMPITDAMYEVLFHGKPPAKALIELMTREPKGELHGIESFFQPKPNLPI